MRPFDTHIHHETSKKNSKKGLKVTFGLESFLSVTMKSSGQLHIDSKSVSP